MTAWNNSLKASDDQIASFLQSTTAWKNSLKATDDQINYLNYINRSPNFSAGNITNATSFVFMVAW